MQITLIKVRGSFLEIFRAKAVNDGEPRFSANFLLDKTKDAKQIKKVEDTIDAILKEKNKGKKLPVDKVCLRDGDEKEYDGYEGQMFISAANKKRPAVVDRDRSTQLVEADGKPMAGDYVNAVVKLWWQDNKFGKRINASLEAVQFVKTGEHFGAPAVNLDEALPDLADDEDDEDGDDGLD